MSEGDPDLSYARRGNRLRNRLSRLLPPGIGPSIPGQAFVAPEVIQTSALDCGPAALKCLLSGMGIPASYDRLREACQTSIDGTSIDALEEAANLLGLEAEQVLVPGDHLLFPCANLLPAVVVVTESGGLPHFIVAWSRFGSVLQLMDPAVGRRWIRAETILPHLFCHEMSVPAVSWREWAESEDFTRVLEARLGRLGLHAEEANRRVIRALQAPGWRPVAALDAATRFAEVLVRAGGAGRGEEAQRVLDGLWDRALGRGKGDVALLPPEHYWSVRSNGSAAGAPATGTEDESEDEVLVRGAIVVRVRKRLHPQVRHKSSDVASRVAADPGATDLGAVSPGAASLAAVSPDITRVLDDPAVRPWVAVARILRRDGYLESAVLGLALLIAAAGTVTEALFWRALLEIGALLGAPLDRTAAALSLAVLVLGLGVLDWAVSHGELRLGRRLELGFRLAFLNGLAALPDRYFRSRLVSDMAERAHRLAALKGLTQLGGQVLLLAFSLVFTTAGIWWLDPTVGPLALLAAAAGVGIPIACHPWLAERDLRLRSHAGALGRFQLDALLGLVAIRAHGGERAILKEHENRLRRWTGAAVDFQRGAVLAQGVQSLAMYGLVIALVLGHLAEEDDMGSTLLLVYWALQLPVLGQRLAFNLRQIPEQRSVAVRLLEPMGAPPEEILEIPPAGRPISGGHDRSEQTPTASSVSAGQRGVHLSFDGVDVRMGGQLVLRDATLEIPSGAHVAILGESGAGKSTLVGLILGFHRPERGEVRVDGERLETSVLAQLRRETAWVDSASQLWNRSLIDNLVYGLPMDSMARAGTAATEVGIDELLLRLPDGLQTVLGEGGGLVSGGEGQRIRVGRARLRPQARLVVFDEPFRGLDHTTRRELLARSRRWWADATMLVVTHDVEDTHAFDLVVILEDGVVREVGVPEQLVAVERSFYHDLNARSAQARELIGSAAGWRRIRIEGGQVG